MLLKKIGSALLLFMKKNGKIVLVINPFSNIDQTIIFLELTFHNVYSSKYKDCIVTHPISQII